MSLKYLIVYYLLQEYQYVRIYSLAIEALLVDTKRISINIRYQWETGSHCKLLKHEAIVEPWLIWVVYGYCPKNEFYHHAQLNSFGSIKFFLRRQWLWILEQSIKILSPIESGEISKL